MTSPRHIESGSKYDEVKPSRRRMVVTHPGVKNPDGSRGNPQVRQIITMGPPPKLGPQEQTSINNIGSRVPGPQFDRDHLIEALVNSGLSPEAATQEVDEGRAAGRRTI